MNKTNSDSLMGGWDSAVRVPLATCVPLGILEIFTATGKRRTHSSVESLITKAGTGHWLMRWQRYEAHFLLSPEEITSLKYGPALKPAVAITLQQGYGWNIWQKMKFVHGLAKYHSLAHPRTSFQVLVNQHKPDKTARLAEDGHTGTCH